MPQLTYSIPDVGRKKRILRIPESHSLYVCPQSCCRRQALRALKNGEAERSSFLKLSQADLVSGDYEGEVAQAVEQLLEILPQRPKVLQVYVNCVDDFVGTDGESLVAGLQEQFPELRFSLNHINPIAVDVASDAMSKMQSGIFALLDKPAAHDAGVNVIGSFEPLPQDTEFHAVLKALGVGPLRHIVTCETFDAYQQMAASCINISAGRMGDMVAEAMEQKFGTKPFAWHSSYSLKQVAHNYESLAALLDSCDEVTVTAVGKAQAAEVLQAARTGAVAALERARAALGDTPLVVDASATFNPCDTARELAEYGFNVQAVLAFHMKGAEAAQEERLAQAFPQVKIFKNQGAVGLQDAGIPQESLSLGRDGAFLFGCKYVADMYHDEGYFGYQGIERLMNLLAEAVG